MKNAFLCYALASCAALSFAGSAGPDFGRAAAQAPGGAPRGEPISLSVDASDAERRIVHVRESIPLARHGDILLFYPQWLPGTHAPGGRVDRLAGLEISADGRPLPWRRDQSTVYGFHVIVPEGAMRLDVQFDYLSAPGEKYGSLEVTSTIMTLEWPALLLYPADQPPAVTSVAAALTLPRGWTLATALDGSVAKAGTTSFSATSLQTLIDSPVYAGRFTSTLDLDPGATAAVRLRLFADNRESLAVTSEQLQAHRNLVQQAYRLLGPPHYDHYDFLLSLSDITPSQGLEHHRSSENGIYSDYFTNYATRPSSRALLPHEFVHSWNGKYRRPADLMTENYNVPMRGDLLWVYEGQTQYWGQVLAVRSKLLSRAEELDALALLAANLDEPGRRWRSLSDTTFDEILQLGRDTPWPSWQRYKDYYDEGALLWLDVDTLIRELSRGRRSLDDFARRFFGGKGGDPGPVPFTFEDIVRVLSEIQPYDWSGFFRNRLDAAGAPVPLEGIRRGGYRLTFTREQGSFQRSVDLEHGVRSFQFSIGLTVGKGGIVQEVRWSSPAFEAGLAPTMQLLAVDDRPYDDNILADAIDAAAGDGTPVTLVVRTLDRVKTVVVRYHGGLRYPHLIRDGAAPHRLDQILAPLS
jgi:predicted metalloprotease with PDZ domain